MAQTLTEWRTNDYKARKESEGNWDPFAGELCPVGCLAGKHAPLVCRRGRELARLLLGNS
jgi:hypothetical protein